MNSNTLVRENSNSKKQIVEDVVSDWLSNNTEYTIKINGEWLKLSDYHDVIKEVYDEDEDDWDSDTIIESVEFYEIDDYFIYLIQPIGIPDKLIRIPLEDISVITNEDTGDEIAWA